MKKYKFQHGDWHRIPHWNYKRFLKLKILKRRSKQKQIENSDFFFFCKLIKRGFFLFFKRLFLGQIIAKNSLNSTASNSNKEERKEKEWNGP